MENKVVVFGSGRKDWGRVVGRVGVLEGKEEKGILIGFDFMGGEGGYLRGGKWKGLGKCNKVVIVVE